MFRIEYYDSLESTNDFIKNRKNESEGLVIVSKEQTKGRGQGNNSWSSEIGGLYFSILLKPDKLLTILPIIAGYTVLETLEGFGVDNLKIKWSNDILYNDSKISGILIESKILNNKPEYIILGCGINVNQKYINNVSEYNPISMKMITNEYYDLNIILNSLLKNFEKNYNRYYINENKELFELINTKIYMKGEKVNILTSNQNIIEGRIEKINYDGALVIKVEDNEKIIYSGKILKKKST
ncbi:MAG: biotin--[acetyl-CoA-carboxylase] ligase [Candidatus Sericytochromatia bacterium]